MSRPISERPGYREGSADDDLQLDLKALARKHKLYRLRARRVHKRVGVWSWGETDSFRNHMSPEGRG
jgi:hypothetical protein